MAQDVQQLESDLAKARERVDDLQQRERRLIEAQRISGVGSYDFDIGSNTNIWSDQLYRIYGREPGSFMASYEVFLSLLHPDDREHVMAVHQHALETVSSYEMEERVVWPDGQVRVLASWGEVIPDDEGRPARMVGICWDITERRAIEEQLVHEALHDSLTALPNRNLLEDRLGMAVAALSRREAPLGLLFVDIDRFKVINDSLGHEVGDKVLVEVGRRIASAIRPGDTVARFGGDEFVIVCEELSSSGEALGIAQRLLEATSAPIVVEGAELVVSVSTGIAVTSDPAVQSGDLLRDADSAMYAAKRGGRGRSVVFVDEMRDEALGRLETETQLRRAIVEDQLRVHYQPILDLETRRLVGVEALVRWEHPTRGLVSPADFVPIAEETGLIVPLGDWVLEQACHQLVTWSRNRPWLTLSVNLSGTQIAQPDIVSRIAAILDRTGAPPQHIALEITESVLMRDADEAMAVLRSLKDLGVRLHVDDFGTGYSSLSYLRRFPVDALKVDRSFVAGLARDPEDNAIVEAILGLSRALGLYAIAEGVENEAQLEALSLLGCEQVQGFLFSHPLLADQITALLGRAIPNMRLPWDNVTHVE